MADSANNWIVPVPVAGLATPSDPVRLPTGAVGRRPGTDHPSDIVVGPGATGAFVVAGLDTVLPYAPATGTFGRADPGVRRGVVDGGRRRRRSGPPADAATRPGGSAAGVASGRR